MWHIILELICKWKTVLELLISNNTANNLTENIFLLHLNISHLKLYTYNQNISFTIESAQNI